MKFLKRFLPYLKNYKRKYIYVLLGLLLSVIGTVGTAYIMKPMMDDLFKDKNSDMLLLIPIFLIGIYTIKGLGRYLQVIYTEYVGLHMVNRLRSELLKKMMSLDMEFIFKNRNGELISRIVNDISQIRFFVSNMLPELLRDGLTLVSLLGYIIYLNPKLALLSLIVIPIILYPLLKLAKQLKYIALKTQGKDADIVSKLNDIFNNYESIKSNTNEDFELNNFKIENDLYFKLQMKSVRKQGLVSPILEIVGAIGLSGVIYLGGNDVINDKMTIGEFTAFLTAVGLIFSPLKNLASIYTKIQPSLASSERIFEILDKQPLINSGKIKLKNKIKNIKFENVSLKYNEDHKALHNINFEIKEGTTVGLIGNSGGGKSSIINLLLKFYEPSNGKILLNDADLNDYDNKSLRESISIVSQRVYIFNDTLAANISYGLEIDEDKIYKALEIADATKFVKNLKNGIYEVLDEFGINLSGGERQRISIARAVYKESSILILDEATSSLDKESEKRINKNLEIFSKDKITFIIAHRMNAIKNANEILMFEDGKIVAKNPKLIFED